MYQDISFTFKCSFYSHLLIVQSSNTYNLSIHYIYICNYAKNSFTYVHILFALSLIFFASHLHLLQLAAQQATNETLLFVCTYYLYAFQSVPKNPLDSNHLSTQISESHTYASLHIVSYTP